MDYLNKKWISVNPKWINVICFVFFCMCVCLVVGGNVCAYVWVHLRWALGTSRNGMKASRIAGGLHGGGWRNLNRSLNASGWRSFAMRSSLVCWSHFASSDWRWRMFLGSFGIYSWFHIILLFWGNFGKWDWGCVTAS